MSGAKTEEPTAARIRKAREEGDTGASTYASQAVALVVAAALLPATVGAAAARVEERLREAIQQAAAPEVTVGFDVTQVAKDVALLSLPIVAGVAVATIVSSFVQTGGFVGRRRVGLSLDRGGPLAGLGAIVSRARIFAVARALAGGAFVGWIVMHELRAHAVDVVRTSGRLAFAGPAAGAMAKAVAWEVALAGLAIAAIDIVVMRTLWRGRLRMSRSEVTRERKEAEGDPAMKGERARVREEEIARGATADVRLATVVIGDGGAFRAVALRYEEGDPAPVVVVTGEGAAAEAILRRAGEHGIVVREDASLARALVAMSVGEAIPEALYDAVAEILREVADVAGAAE